MSKSLLPQPIEIKISTVVAICAILHSADPLVLDAALTEMTGGTPDFFEDEFTVIDVSHLSDAAAPIDWDALVALFKTYHLNVVAVRGAAAALGEEIRAHGLSLDEGGKEHAVANTEPVPMRAPPALKIVSPPAPVVATVAGGAMFIDIPVRAGQRIYARGCDLIVTAVVNHGAELIADGSIHVYAALYGRALAGASGNPEARIFALSMVPELVSIGGIYRTFEDGFPPELARVPTQIRRVGDRLDILAVTQASRA